MMPPEFSNIPYEVLEHIWCSDNLDYQDICRLSTVCKRFNDVSQSNEVWKRKLSARWPNLLHKYPRNSWPNWKKEFISRYRSGQLIVKKIDNMSALYYSWDEVPRSGFADLTDMLTCTDNTPLFIIDELMCILHDGNRHINLTNKYYAEKAIRHIQQIYLKQKWEALHDLDPTQQQFESGAVLIAQWWQPTCDITESDICSRLDDIAKAVKRVVCIRSLDHPLNKVETLCDINETVNNLWSPEKCRVVLESLNYVLYEDMGFRGNEDNYYDPGNSLINKVLEKRTGIPITLAVLYIAIARRLGVFCEPVNFPTHFLIKWKEFPHLSEGRAFTYIDAFNKGKFFTQQECMSILGHANLGVLPSETYNAIPPVKVWERMARNLMNIGRQQGQMGDGLLCLRTATELFLVISPNDMESRILLSRLYLHLNINLTDVIEHLQGVAEVDQYAPSGLLMYLTQAAQAQLQNQQDTKYPEKIKEKRKSDRKNGDVNFPVGLIMNHRRYNYMCVIYGWDPQCEASQEWIIQMGVHNLPKKHLQPFYNVLVEDGSNRYAAQESLEVASDPSVITHPEIGKYFKEFCGKYYLPNSEKQQEYPEDLSFGEKHFPEQCGHPNS